MSSILLIKLLSSYLLSSIFRYATHILVFVTLAVCVSVGTIVSQAGIGGAVGVYYSLRMWLLRIIMLTRWCLWSSSWTNQQCTSLRDLNSSSISLSHYQWIWMHLLLNQILTSISIKRWWCSLVTFYALFTISFNSLHVLYSIRPIIYFLCFLPRSRLFIIFTTDARQSWIVVLSSNP